MSKSPTDEMTDDDWRGVQRLLLAVEGRLNKADDVLVAVEQLVSRAATLVGIKDREQFERHLRILIGPLVRLELERRNDLQIKQSE